MIKVMTVLGTRPEIIRLSRVIAKLDKYCDHVLVHTGQNHDYLLNEVFFSDLELRQPDHYLGVDTKSLGACVGGILLEVERVIQSEKPDALLVLGDTNSAISTYIAKRLRVPVYHMEAGNRCFDKNVPEETNRKMVDHLSDFNLVYSEHARRNLLAEGLPARRIYLTGSPMREVLEHYMAGIDSSDVLNKMELTENGYILASLHREENVDDMANFKRLIVSLNNLALQYDRKVIVSTHPRTKKRLDVMGLGDQHKGIQWLPPFGFNDYVKLQKHATCVVSDSGTIAEESSILSFPAVTPRFSIERPEAQDTGAIMACGSDPEVIVDCVRVVLDSRKPTSKQEHLAEVPEVYKIRNVSDRVVRLILSTAKISNQWDGIREIEARL